MNPTTAAQESAPSTKSKEMKAKKKHSGNTAALDGLSPDLPKSILSINQIVDDKGRLTGELLVKAKDRRGAEVIASLDERELALGRCDSLAHFAVKAGLQGFLSPKGLRTLAVTIPECTGEEVYVARRGGYHSLVIQGKRYSFFVLGEKVCFLSSKPPLLVAVVNDTGDTVPPSGSLESWHEAIGVYLPTNPYMLVSVLSAIAPALVRAFGLSVPILAIIGPSSIGKTTLQQVGRSPVERAEKIDDASGTINGLRVKMEQHPDMSVFFQDIHKNEDVEGLMSLIFLVGNGGQRFTSTANQKVQAGAELSCGLSLSSELLFMEMVGNAKSNLPEGFSARCFEMVLQGPHGAFHTLPKGVAAHDFANQLKRACGEHYGAVWAAWIPAIAKNADKIRAWLPKAVQEAEAALLDGLEIKDSVTLRLVSGLAVWLVAGNLAIKLKVLKLKAGTVTEALRLVLREHLSRQAHRTTPIGEKVISTVRDYIDRNANRFPALAMFANSDQSNPLGYTKGSGRELVYLFLLGEFEKLLGEKFGLQMALQKLDEAGYLIKNGEGWQVQMRLHDGLRKRFYAIHSSIRFDGDTEADLDAIH